MNQPDVTSKDRFLSSRQRYQPIALAEDFSNEEMARDWTLSVDDRAVLDRSQKRFRLYGAVQLCAVRLYGRINRIQASMRNAVFTMIPGTWASPIMFQWRNA